MRSFFLAKGDFAEGAQIWRISAHKFSFNFVGEIEWAFFAKLCLPATSTLAKKVR